MARPFNANKVFGSWVAAVELPPVPLAHDVVIVAVNDEQRRVDRANAFDVWILVARK